MEWKGKIGETPLDDISGLKLRVLNPTRSQIEKFEGRNIAKAQEKYFARRLSKRSAPFDLPWLKKLHKEMLGDVWNWAGEFRVTDKSIGVPKEHVQILLLQMLDDLHAWPEMGMDWVEQAARLHHRAVQIHPFENGNGRWARMLTDIWLRHNKQPIIMWPVTVDKESPIRKEYLESLRLADEMKEQKFIDMHKKFQNKE